MIVFFILILLVLIFPTILIPSFRIFDQKPKTNQKSVALTFDDGPDPEITPQILKILKREKIKATFFVLGQKVRAHPQIAKQIAADGHQIANHSFAHDWYAGFKFGRLIDNDFIKTQEIIKITTGKSPKLIRTPHGFAATWFLKNIKQKGLTPVFWSLDSGDWRSNATGQKVIDQVIKNIKPSSIILMHDGHGFKVGRQKHTAKALPEIIQKLKSQGFEFKTIS